MCIRDRVTAIIVGAALSVSGAVMQCVLRNPLASASSLGVSPVSYTHLPALLYIRTVRTRFKEVSQVKELDWTWRPG